MSVFKWSFIFLLVVFPLFLLAAEYLGHTAVVIDAETATRAAAQAAIKANLAANSLRDADVYPDNHVIRYNSDTIQSYFDQSVSRKVEKTNDGKGYITIAVGEGAAGVEIHSLSGPYPEGYAGFHPGKRGSDSPPMVAIRTNVVRKSLLYSLLGKFAPVSEYYNIQSQKIAILEVK